jgi:hypothetical protein
MRTAKETVFPLGLLVLSLSVSVSVAAAELVLRVKNSSMTNYDI